jgi:hypothetical protein
VTVGFSLNDEREHLPLNSVRKGSAKQPEDGRWSNDNRFAQEEKHLRDK